MATQENGQEPNSSSIPSTILSVENTSRRNLLVLGGISTLVFGCLCYALATEALRSSNPVLGALSVATALIGMASMHLSLKNSKSFKAFGPTALLLNPAKPGIGGQLGASFSLNPQVQNNTFGPAAELTATLTCIQFSKSRSGSNSTGTSFQVLWQDKIPVFQNQTSKGIDAQLVFDLPQSDLASDEQNVQWSLLVEGDFGALGKLSRTWNIDIEDATAAKMSTLNIPAQLIAKHDAKEQKQAHRESTKDIPIHDDGTYVELNTRGLPKGAEVVGCLFGVAFTAMGLFIMRSGDAGFGAIFIACGMIGFALAILGAFKKIEIKINKQTRIFNLTNTFLGFATSSHEATVRSAGQFVVKSAVGDAEGGGSAGFYNVCFESNGEILKLHTWIEGEYVAKALRDRLVAELFSTAEIAAAA